jgi:DNA-binding transcriptional LysR family regulator
VGPGSEVVDSYRGVAGIEFRHLRAFVAVAEELNFTRAAEALQLTQPALSRTIAQLERLVGVNLIQRTRRSVGVTAAGERFLAHARRALLVVEEAARAARGDPSFVWVGFTWGATSEYIGPVVRAFEETHPGVVVQLRRYDQTLAGLADGRATVGFLPGDPHDPRVRTMVLSEEPRVAALPVDHPLTARTEVELDDLRSQAIVINVVSGTTTPDLWGSGGGPAAEVHVCNVDEWMEAIAAGRGIGLTPASTGRLYTHPRIRYRPVIDAPAVPMALCWPSVGAHPLVPDFIKAAEECKRALKASQQQSDLVALSVN